MKGKSVGNGQLVELAGRIDASYVAFQKSAMDAIGSAVECGTLLLEAKAELRYGEWLPWLEANTRVSARQSQKLMRLARHAGEVTANANSNSHLTIDSMLASLNRRSNRRGQPSAVVAEALQVLRGDLEIMRRRGAASRVVRALVAVCEIEITPRQAARQFENGAERDKVAEATDIAIAWLRDFGGELERPPAQNKGSHLRLVTPAHPDDLPE